MNKFQEGIKFRSLPDFFDHLSPVEHKIVECLREIILATIPDCIEKLAYNVPFYYRHKRLFYIWPSSVPWGGLKTGVALGFCQGAKMNNMDGVLKGDGKEIRQIIFNDLGEINKELIQDLLIEAYEIDRKGKSGN